MALIAVLITGCSVESPTPEETPTILEHIAPGGSDFEMGAAEWNDLDNWMFWKDLVNGEFHDQSRKWRYHTNYRLAFELTAKGKPAPNVKLELKKGDTSEWISRTDNLGRAELWIDLYRGGTHVDLSKFRLYIDDQLADVSLKLYEEGINHIAMGFVKPGLNRVEIAFIADATGSMKEEFSYLQRNIEPLLKRIENADPTMELRTSAVLFRDEKDDFVVKSSDFNSDNTKTIEFLNSVQAEGGSDHREAVDLALNQAIQRLNWTENARTRIAFLLLDGPPRFWAEKIVAMQQTIRIASARGIKIIPITAAGIDVDAEFLTRFFAVATNGTYTFLTSDNDTKSTDPTVGSFDTNELNKLMGEIILRYSILK
ncbi:MAG: VWA domain-containing protein [Flavobacteriales bacterium]|nr:VWA domain-containing protein [Flavobacteriales bacterium]